jgi:hypothetical protein
MPDVNLRPTSKGAGSPAVDRRMLDEGSRRAEREEKVLMPHSAPPPDGLPPRPRSRSRTEKAAVDARRQDERAFVRLAAQLHALEHDIQTARATSHRSPEGIASLLHGHAGPPLPRPVGERVRRRDGAEILIRPIEPQDRTSSGPGSSASAPFPATDASSARSNA